MNWIPWWSLSPEDVNITGHIVVPKIVNLPSTYILSLDGSVMFVHGWTMTSSWTLIVYDEVKLTVPDQVVCARPMASFVCEPSSSWFVKSKFANVVDRVSKRTKQTAEYTERGLFSISQGFILDY